MVKVAIWENQALLRLISICKSSVEWYSSNCFVAKTLYKLKVVGNMMFSMELIVISGGVLPLWKNNLFS